MTVGLLPLIIVICLKISGMAVSQGFIDTALKFPVLAIVGAILVFRRGGVIFDRRTGLATKWWGLVIPFKKETYRLDALRKVTIRRETRSSGENSTYTVYVVRVAHSEAKFHIVEPKDFPTARRKAEHIAKFLHLPLYDHTEGKVRIRQAGELDYSIREQAQSAGEKIVFPPYPEGCRIRHELSGGKLVLKTPPAGSLALALTMMTILIVAVFAILEYGLQENPIPMLGNLGIACVLLLFFRPYRSLVATGHKQITVSPDALEVCAISPIGRITRSIPANEIEEFYVTTDTDVPGDNLSGFLESGTAIVARSDRQTLCFGWKLNKEEIRWMYSAIKHTLIS